MTLRAGHAKIHRMPNIDQTFELTLSYPQWQGSGRHQNLTRGADAVAEVCARYAPSARVPVSMDGKDEAGINRWTAIHEQFLAAQAILAEKAPRRVLTAGGDCAVDVAVINYLLGLYPDLHVVWVDAHLDANTPSTSPSGNFHGMPVAAIMGHAPDAMKPYLAAPLPAARFRYVSAHVGDPGDWAFQEKHGLGHLQDVADIAGPLHIHFDLDVFDPEEFPYLAYLDGVMKVEDGVGLVRTLSKACDLVGLTITEFAPANAADAVEGSRVVARLCEAAHGR